MKKDIESREDIRLLVKHFYEQVKQDPLLAPFFTDHVQVNWEKHLPLMVSFWENVIFYNGSYSGNPLQTHLHLHQQFPVTQEHFNRWLQLFADSVNHFYEGEKAELIKKRAKNIATVMTTKFGSGNH